MAILRLVEGWFFFEAWLSGVAFRGGAFGFGWSKDDDG